MILPNFVPQGSILKGIAASPGIAIGKACVINRRRRHVPRYQLTTGKQVEKELIRFKKAQEEARLQLISAKDNLPEELLGQAAIFEAYLMLLDDPLLTKNAIAFIEEEKLNAEWALIEATKKISSLLNQLEDEYIKSRLTDVETVAQSIIGALLTDEKSQSPADCSPGSILVAPDLSPAEVAQMAGLSLAGMVTERGSRTSHTAIVVQALELAAVIGVSGLLANIKNGDTLIIDGTSGHVIVSPDQDTLAYYQSRQKIEAAFQAEIVRSAHLPAVTLDDKEITVLGNLELYEELPAILSYGGEGVGLYRTEFLYLAQNYLPTEEDLFQVYKKVVEQAAPYEVTIRTLDIGDDKVMPQLPIKELEAAYNTGGPGHAYGLRGIRYCLKNRQLFLTQLKAILRAAVFGQAKIMLPMISSLEELLAAKEILGEARHSLQQDGHNFKEEIPLGIMVEVPSAVLMADVLAQEADFFSIGTNDLIQYSLAVDRGNQATAELYQPLHPAILKMLKMTIEAGERAGKKVSICGDMAADTLTAPVLIGLGAKILSMPPTAIPRIKRLVRMSSFYQLVNWSNELLTSSTAEEAHAKASLLIKDKYPEFFREA